MLAGSSLGGEAITPAQDVASNGVFYSLDEAVLAFATEDTE
jgi:hypothetical protein